MECDRTQEPSTRECWIIELREPFWIQVDEATEIFRVAVHPLGKALHLALVTGELFQMLPTDISAIQENLHLVDPIEGDISWREPVSSLADLVEEGNPVLEDQLLDLIPSAKLAREPVERIRKNSYFHAGLLGLRVTIKNTISVPTEWHITSIFSRDLLSNRVSLSGEFEQWGDVIICKFMGDAQDTIVQSSEEDT